MDNIITYQFFVLLVGTLFSWSNFIMELVAWCKKIKCPIDCNCSKGSNPFKTPCFFGAIFFTISFVLSALMYFN